MGYGFGITTWLFAVKYLKHLGGLGPSLQATAWFVLTVVGVAIATGEFLGWPTVDKLLAVTCISSFALLVYRVSAA